MGKKSLGLWDIVLLNLVAVVSLRWLASAAAAGPGSLTLWVLAAVFFFLPEGLAVAELSCRFPGEGGLYRWTKASCGNWHGFLCGWCYWVNNLLYFPALLLYVSGNVAFALQSGLPGARLEGNTTFVASLTIGVLWAIAGVSVAGVGVGKWIQNVGGVGNWSMAVLVTVLGAVAFLLYGSANDIGVTTIVPSLGDFSQLSFFATLCFALAGLELVSFFGGEVKNPRRTISAALLVSGALILVVYLTGTIGILVSVPQERITTINGLLLPIREVGDKLGIPWLAPLSAVVIAGGGVACTLAWFSGAARVPYLVGVDRYLPSSFGKLHPRLGTPYVAILVQTGLATLLALFATVGDTRLESAYKIMVDMCLILYFIPYCYLFLSLRRLRAADRGEAGAYRVPGGSVGNWLASYVGLATTVLAIGTTLLPAGPRLDAVALAKTIGGTLLMIGVGGLLYLRGKSAVRKEGPLRPAPRPA